MSSNGSEARPTPARQYEGVARGLIGGVIGGLVAFTTINYCSRVTSVAAQDAVSIANTYIVYTTFLMAAVAAALTFGGLLFTRQFAMDKEAHVAHAYEVLICEIEGSNGKAVKIIQEVMKNPDVVQHFDVCVSEKLNELVSARMAANKNQAAKVQAEQDAVESLAKDLG